MVKINSTDGSATSKACAVGGPLGGTGSDEVDPLQSLYLIKRAVGDSLEALRVHVQDHVANHAGLTVGTLTSKCTDTSKDVFHVVIGAGVLTWQTSAAELGRICQVAHDHQRKLVKEFCTSKDQAFDKVASCSHFAAESGRAVRLAPSATGETLASLLEKLRLDLRA